LAGVVNGIHGDRPISKVGRLVATPQVTGIDRYKSAFGYRNARKQNILTF
jgi:hypothetical protein